MMVRVLLVGVFGVTVGACADRTHMREGFGEATRRAMANQVVNPDAGGPAPSKGLDPQEATVVARSYQRSLSPKDQAAPSEPMLFVSPQAQKNRGDYLPPPSVPSEGK
jgi:hypothetical protein